MFTYRLPARPPVQLHRLSTVGQLWVCVVIVLAGCMSPPGHVAEVTVANPTDYHPTVEVTGDDGSGWLLLGRVPPGSERTIEEVIDFGESWTFRFALPEHREEVTIDRAELVRRGWRIEVPARFGERLEELGVEPGDFAG